MATRKDFIQTDPQVISCPPIFAKNAKIRLIAECATCHNHVDISLIRYWKIRQHGPWSCYGCRKPDIDAKASQNKLYNDPAYCQRFAALHDDPDYHAKVHNNEINAKISTSSKLAWQDDTKRTNHMDHRQTAESRAAIGARAKISWERRQAKSQQQRSTDFAHKADVIHDGKYDYSATHYQRTCVPITIYCRTCRTHFTQLPMVHLRGSGCPRCNVSPGQREIYDLLATRFESLLNDRAAIKPLEIDIYLPKQRLGIEYHGLFWHSYNRLETKEERIRHQQKHLLAKDNGITLLQFCDHEWRDRRHIVTSMIEHRLGLSTPVNARSLTITPLNTNESKKFFDDNHLAGYRSANSCTGLVDGAGDTIMAMSCNWLPGHTDIEIIRMANKVGRHVRGGASRLLRWFINHLQPRCVYTFADLRYSTGAGYKMIGFTEEHITRPGYFYHRDGKIRSRLRCQKHKLQKLLDNFDQSLSEAANMFAHNYRRFWDAGHMKLAMKCHD